MTEHEPVRVVAVALTFVERTVVVEALRELARRRRAGPERRRAEEIAEMLASAIPLGDVGVRVALSLEDEEPEA